ncbi:hypothetical protein Poly51_18170 [Rubripirellula tenax]|uniref:Cytochrome c domain-containing protein n=1 Tax=Rubripirellula tenax TaxID=2528015 RepID=A0A5C6FE61_9BACT|nr:di-heme oxidoredictase family protein [Rubripirellula tenax]TWU59032.1 hypothetical protein Poly51_18170 [Rubripirellula tenax]
MRRMNLGKCSFRAFFTLTTLTLVTTPTWAAEPTPQKKNIERGREIFEREWTSRDPAPIPRRGDEQDIEYARKLVSLPGDGLGPMHNATSCAACHVGGGAAGVEHNVTLLTLDPRSDFITKSAAFRLRNRQTDDVETDPDLKELTAKQLQTLHPSLVSPSGAVAMDVVVHDHSSRPFYDRIRSDIAQHVPGGIDDEWFNGDQRTSATIGDRPVIAGRFGGIDFYLSQRNSPPLFGLSLIDRVSIAKLRGVALSQARRSGGKVTGRVGAGKFGWRGQTTTLAAFVEGACAGELGLQVPSFDQPADAADETYVSIGYDLNEHQLRSLHDYVASIPPPPVPRSTPESHTGRRVFNRIGCNVCHVANMMPASGIYSDLLLHDMGVYLQAPSPAALGSPGKEFTAPVMQLPRFASRPTNDVIAQLSDPTLQLFRTTRGSFARLGSSVSGYYGSGGTPTPYPFKRPEKPMFPRGDLPKQVAQGNQLYWDVLQREWRTPPLWGVADTGPYLHDGRAETLDAAIRWHDGEGEASATLYRSLSEADRTSLIQFLESLKAPIETPAEDSVDMLSLLGSSN